MIITNLEDNCKHLQSMTINVLIQLKGIIERALSSTAKLSKSFRKFYSEAMILFITMFGRINYSAMARSSDYCESRFRQNFKKEFDWIKFNAQFVKKGGSRRNAIAIDPSYIDKSGKKIPGLGYFWSGCAKMAKWGLEILGIAFIDADTKKAVHLRAVQTFKDGDADTVGENDRDGRQDFAWDRITRCWWNELQEHLLLFCRAGG